MDDAQVIPKTTKCQQELETRLKLPWVIHTTVSIFVLCNLYSTDILQQLCNSCVQKKEKECAGPLGLTCDFCWKQKKSCTNRGKWIILFSQSINTHRWGHSRRPPLYSQCYHEEGA